MTAIDPERLFGFWRLVGSRALDSAGRRLADPWGPAPLGSLTLTPEGRMIAVLCDGRRDLPAGVPRAYSSYGGAFVVEGDRLTTTIDVASDTSRIGTKQPRRLLLEGDRLTLTPPPRADGSQREILWQRAS